MINRKNIIALLLSFFFIIANSWANPRVIIIGAGIAGLAAANTLVENHIPTLVLEARNRIGGRINTFYSWGSGLDLGASWIHGTSNSPIASLVRQQKIETIPTVYNSDDFTRQFGSSTLYYALGKKLPANEIKTLVALSKKFNMYLDDDEKEFKGQSIEAVFKQFAQKARLSIPTANLLHYGISSMYATEYGDDLAKLSAAVDAPYEHSVITGSNNIFPYGYQQIFPALVKNIPIALNQTVNKIVYGSNGVDVYTQDNHYHADRVIITVPLGVLKSGAIHFTPQLPKEKLASIQNIGMGVLNKVYLLFNHAFWDQHAEWISSVSLTNHNDMTDIMNLYKYIQQPVLVMFISGSLARNMEHWNDKSVVEYMMRDLKSMYGNNIPPPSSYVITRWNSDPFSRGSYSYFGLHSDLSDYKTLAEPVMNRLFFAGEATSSTDPATVAGAYITGVRAAKEVLKILNVTKDNNVKSH